MKKLLLTLTLVAAVAAPTATGGGWATVGLSSLPTGTAPGDKWSVDLTVLQHGRTPLAGIAPVLTISSPEGGTRSFTAVPTDRVGVYHADVVFPSEGTWTYQVWDDFSQTHSYQPVEITRPGGFPVLELLLALGIALALAAATILLLRRRPRPQPVRLGEAA